MNNKNIIITIISLIAVVIIGIMVFGNAKTSLGSVTPETGDSTLKTTTSGESVICAVPCVLHRIIFGTANDTLKLINSPTTYSGNSAMTITATVPDEFVFDTVFSEGLTTYVTSTNGVLFVTSPY